MTQQKLPLRSMYVAPKGKTLCGFDLSAAEAWVVAYLADDANMKRELADGDLHSYSAVGIFERAVDLSIPGKKKYDGVINEEERYIGKKMNHAGNYRTGPLKEVVLMIKSKQDTDYYKNILGSSHIEENLNFLNEAVTAILEYLAASLPCDHEKESWGLRPIGTCKHCKEDLT